MAQLASGAQLPSRAEAERSILLVAAIAAEGACSASSISSRALTAWAITSEEELVAWIVSRRSTGSAMSVPTSSRTQENTAWPCSFPSPCTAIGAAATRLSSGSSPCMSK
jgi:hypothetical protein